MAKVNLRERIPTAWKSRAKIQRARLALKMGNEAYSWPALNSLDRRLAERLPSGGTFLEIGANDGYTQSNTYFLEKLRGWRGILIEPLPSMFAICQSHRNASLCYNVACVGPDGPRQIELVDRGLMAVSLGLLDAREEDQRVAGRNARVRVPTTTLSQLIDTSQLGTPTFVSIDVEGAELHVLAGLELSRHTPDFLLVETQKLDEVERILAGKMQVVESLSHHDWLFRRLGA